MKSFKLLFSGLCMLAAQAGGAFAGSLTGIVLDQAGAPAAGVNVEAVYQTYTADQRPYGGESIKRAAITDAEGRYTIDFDGMPPGEYSANAYRTVVNGRREMIVDMVAEDPATFASSEDAIRNFKDALIEESPDMPYGNAGVFVLNNAISEDADLSEAEVSFENLDTGRGYVKTVRRTGEGLVATGLPFGTYRVSVTLGGRPMQISLLGPGYPENFSDSVTHDFTMGYLENQIQVQVKR